MPEVMTVLIEYVPSQSRVMVRGVWRKEEYKPVAPLLPDNVQNAVHVFLGVDMKFNVGFAGLTQEN
jgi:hypothetical protein